MLKRFVFNGNIRCSLEHLQRHNITNSHLFVRPSDILLRLFICSVSIIIFIYICLFCLKLILLTFDDYRHNSWNKHENQFFFEMWSFLFLLNHNYDKDFNLLNEYLHHGKDHRGSKELQLICFLIIVSDVCTVDLNARMLFNFSVNDLISIAIHRRERRQTVFGDFFSR